jgi:L-amino acid N-acyltransferase YncA
MRSSRLIRDVRSADAGAIAAIYRPIVENTIISFEETAPSAEEFQQRIARVTAHYPWLVEERDGSILGYAYGSRWRDRHAYRYSVEVTVYVDESAQRLGIARALYGELFSRLSSSGFHRAFAGISLPNDASVALHRAMGFEPVGTYREAGYKFGRWIDVSWWQRAL